MRLPGVQPARRYRSLSPGRIRPHNGTGAHKGHAFFAYADNYLIDLKAAIIVDVEATRAIRQAEVGAARTMIERTEDLLALNKGDSKCSCKTVLAGTLRQDVKPT
jgi:hypothetical protein